MRLSILCEEIRQSDFFDLYALDSAKPLDAEQQQYYEMLVSEVYAEFFYGLAEVAILRWCNDDRNHLVPADLVARVEKYGRDKTYISRLHKDRLRRHSPDDLVRILNSLVAEGKFGFTGERWTEIARTVNTMAAKWKASTGDKMITLDSAIGTCHHDGTVTDYFDEKWLADAMNVVAAARDRGQLYRHMSSYGKSLIRHRQHAISDVSFLEKVLVTVDRTQKRQYGYMINNINIISGNEAEITFGYWSGSGNQHTDRGPRGWMLGMQDYGELKELTLRYQVAGDSLTVSMDGKPVKTYKLVDAYELDWTDPDVRDKIAIRGKYEHAANKLVDFGELGIKLT